MAKIVEWLAVSFQARLPCKVGPACDWVYSDLEGDALRVIKLTTQGYEKAIYQLDVTLLQFFFLPKGLGAFWLFKLNAFRDHPLPWN